MHLPRTMFRWSCQLLASTGGTTERQFESYWSPDRVTSESVALACAAQETVKAKHKVQFQPISAQLITP